MKGKLELTEKDVKDCIIRCYKDHPAFGKRMIEVMFTITSEEVQGFFSYQTIKAVISNVNDDSILKDPSEQ